MAAVEISDEIADRFATMIGVPGFVARAVLEVAGAAIVTDVLSQFIGALDVHASLYEGMRSDGAARGVRRAIEHLTDYREHTAAQSGMPYDPEPPRELPAEEVVEFYKTFASDELAFKVYAAAHQCPVSHVNPESDAGFSEVLELLRAHRVED